MKRISSRRFEALFYVRVPFIKQLASEVRHYESSDTSNLAVITFDKIDKDFGYLILGRDSRKLFRCIKVCNSFFSTEKAAEKALRKEMKFYETDGRSEYPQGDEVIPTFDIFAPIVADDKQHDFFKMLISNERRTAARNLIQEIAYSFVDVDGNYVEQFQSTGFDQRMWELFLYILFNKSDFGIDNSEQAPDFALSKFGMAVFVEAVTVGPNPDFDVIPNNAAEIAELSKDYMPIKFGSPLFSKLVRKNKKKYWEMPHVAGHPLILAIHDYHGQAMSELLGSMTWSKEGLASYLYGVRNKVVIDGETITRPKIVGRNGLEPVIEIITEHRYGEKEIPSRFFGQKDAENISAVLFSNGATIATFERMGKITGLGDHDIKIMRGGVRIGKDGQTPEMFTADVDADDYDETWGDTVMMFHNPWAKHPIHVGLFPNISHVFLDLTTNIIYYKYLPKHVASSRTIIGVPE